MVNRGPQLVQLMNGIAVAAVGRVEQLGQAVVAHGHVRRHERLARPCALALDDTKPGVATDRRPR